MANAKLTTENRNFFSLVSQASFTNPFSEQRLAIDRKISGNTHSKSWLEFRPEAIREVERQIAILDANSIAKIKDFKQADQQMIEHVFLFQIYHRFNKPFDQFIIDQINAGQESLTAPFAKEAIPMLIQRGFTPQKANRYFSLFYQIRRAFYFIERGLIGQCPSMMQLRMHLWNNIFTHNIINYEQSLWDRMEDFSTLLLGPTGCGKGAAAAAIGRSGYIPFNENNSKFARIFTESFVPINLSEYPESLLESELFGHSKGAFTGAISSHDGIFALCGPHGSIFLDEIGDISTQVQIKLLNILQERYFSPVGSHKKLRFEGRVIAATNRSIDELRQQGKFRDDFYYRLCSDCINVPSLYERIEENPQELADLIASLAKRITGNESEDLIDTVIAVIDKRLGRNYRWPGNVRELEQCVRSVIIKQDYLGDSKTVEKGHDNELCQAIENGSLTAEELLCQYCTALYEKFGTYEEVARRSRLDRRTVKKYIQRQDEVDS